jgi:hypothetical protein
VNENPDQGPYRTSAQENETLQALRSLAQGWRLFWTSVAFLHAIVWKGLKNDLGHFMPILTLITLMFFTFRVGEFVGYSHHEAQETENARLNLENEFLLDASRQLLIENYQLEAAANAREFGWDAIVVDEFGTQCLDPELEGPEGTCPIENELPATSACDCSTPACCSYDEYLRATER